jgi:hypothetical protein
MGDEEHGGVEKKEDSRNQPAPVRRWIALGLLAVLAGLAWTTMGAGKIRAVVLILLLAFALRIALTSSGLGAGR